MRDWEPGISFTKDPRTRDEYIIIVEDWLREGDLLKTFVITGTVPVGQIGLNKISEALTENQKNIIVWIEGGLEGDPYPVGFEFTTVNGYRDKFSVLFHVIPQ